MKFISFLLLTLIACTFSLEAQLVNRSKRTDRPRAFKDLPVKFAVNTQDIQQIFEKEINDKVQIRFHDKFYFNAIIIDKETRSSGTTSVNLRSSSYPGILFNFSRTVILGKRVQYHSRALHPDYGDVLLLMGKDQQYFFEVKEAEKLIAE